MRKDRQNRNKQNENNENMFRKDNQSIGNNATHSESLQGEDKQEKKQKKLGRGMRSLGVLALVVSIISFTFSNTTSVDGSETAKNAIEKKVSTGASAGIVLLKDDENLGSDDYTITHQSDAEEMKIWIWDYAAEDGDYVQVLVDGTPITETFMIKHKPRVIMVPTTGNIEVKGIRDGGGGITYAVRYDVTGTSYFNTAPEGDVNTYEIVKE